MHAVLCCTLNDNFISIATGQTILCEQKSIVVIIISLNVEKAMTFGVLCCNFGDLKIKGQPCASRNKLMTYNEQNKLRHNKVHCGTSPRKYV